MFLTNLLCCEVKYCSASNLAFSQLVKNGINRVKLVLLHIRVLDVSPGNKVKELFLAIKGAHERALDSGRLEDDVRKMKGVVASVQSYLDQLPAVAKTSEAQGCRLRETHEVHSRVHALVPGSPNGGDHFRFALVAVDQNELVRTSGTCELALGLHGVGADDVDLVGFEDVPGEHGAPATQTARSYDEEAGFLHVPAGEGDVWLDLHESGVGGQSAAWQHGRHVHRDASGYLLRVLDVWQDHVT